MDFPGSGGRSFGGMPSVQVKAEQNVIMESGLRVYIATWNVNSKSPEGINLSILLAACDIEPDIYAIGLQEMGMFKANDSWRDAIMAGLHPKGNYVHLKPVQSGTIFLLVVVRFAMIENDLLHFCASSTSRNITKTKGAVGLSLLLKSVSICFVNAHFCPHVHKSGVRQTDHDQIYEALHFHHENSSRRINDHDVVFFFGDLNYRVNNNPKRMRESIEYHKIIHNDQLQGEMQLGNVFVGYKEGKIYFRPTYRYNPGTDDWDTSEKRRDPAWCDRILWKGHRVKQVAYQSEMCLKLSDHKPVRGLFEILGGTTVPNTKTGSTSVSLHKKEVTFPRIKFYQTYKETFSMSNRRRSSIFVRIKLEQESHDFHEHWLDIEPKECELAPSQFMTVKLTLRVTSHTACVLQSKAKNNTEHITLGYILFEQPDETVQRVAVLGSYAQSCFGHTMEDLIKIPMSRMMKSTGFNQRGKLAMETILEHPKYSKVPNVISKLIQHLKCHALDVPDLFVDVENNRKFRDHQDIDRILQNLGTDCDKALQKFDSHAVAEVLLMILESAPTPLIATSEWDPNSKMLLKDVMPKTSAVNRSVLLHVIQFLRSYVKHKLKNKSDIGRLSILFGRILLKEHPAIKNPKKVGPAYDDLRTMFLVEVITSHDFDDLIEIYLK